MEKKNSFNRVNIESLFNALYTDGRARLSDHFINESEESESAKNNGFSVEHYKNVLTAEYWGAGVPRTFEFSGRKVKIYPPKNNGDLWTVIDYEDILNTVEKMSLQSAAEFLSELSAK